MYYYLLLIIVLQLVELVPLLPQTKSGEQGAGMRSRMVRFFPVCAWGAMWKVSKNPRIFGFAGSNSWKLHVCILSRLNHVPLFCNSMECSPPGSSVSGILQTRTLDPCLFCLLLWQLGCLLLAPPGKPLLENKHT